MSTHQLLPVLDLMMLGKLNLRPSVLLVLLFLASLARGTEGKDAWPSIAYIVRSTRLDKKTVVAALQTLRTLPIIKVQAKATRHFPTIYSFDMPYLLRWRNEAALAAGWKTDNIALAEEDAGHKVGRRLQPQRPVVDRDSPWAA